MNALPAARWNATLACVLLAAGCAAPGCSRRKPSSTETPQDAAQEVASETGLIPDATIEAMDDSADGKDTRPHVEAAPGEYCISDWPSPSAGQVRPELIGRTPNVMWSKKVASLVGTSNQVVMSRGAVGLTAGSSLIVVNKATVTAKVFTIPQGDRLAATIVSADDHFLLAGRSAYAVDEAGNAAWSVPLGGGPPIGSESAMCGLLYSRKLATLMAVCNNGSMYGISTRDGGKLIWSTPLYSEGLFDVKPGPSVGGVAVVRFGPRHSEAGSQVFDPASGRRLGAAAGPELTPWSVSSQGLLATSPSLALLDECGRTRWRSESSLGVQVPMVIGVPGERVFVYERIEGAPARLGMVSAADGSRLAGPTASGTPVAAGADGTFYAVSCDNASLSGSEGAVAPDLVAYTPELTEKWRLSLPVPPLLGKYYGCPRAGVALDDNGVMYLAVESDGTYLVAVQTGSPGPAATSWPLRFGGQTGSLWHE
jgi:hypothetical protein